MTPPTVDPVDGAHVGPVREIMYASVARGVHGDCGLDGVLYEHEADVFVRLGNAWQVPATDAAKFSVYVVCYAMMLRALTTP